MAAIEKLVRNFTETDIDDEIVIMRLDNGELLSLSGTGAAIWRLTDGSRDRQALAEAIAAEYSIGMQQSLQEIDEFLDQLAKAGLIAGG